MMPLSKMHSKIIKFILKEKNPEFYHVQLPIPIGIVTFKIHHQYKWCQNIQPNNITTIVFQTESYVHGEGQEPTLECT